MIGVLAVLGVAGPVNGQPSSPPGLTIAQAVDAALRAYPSIQVSQEQINAAAAGIQLARTAYLPKVDALAQANRATRNNVFGLLLPQSVVPSISGPVLGTNTFGTAWGSAVGILVTWEPFDFGLRRASVNAATAARTQSEALQLITTVSGDTGRPNVVGEPRARARRSTSGLPLRGVANALMS